MGFGQTLVETDHQVLAGLTGGLHHGLAVLLGGGHGLFAQHVLARLQGLDADGGMETVCHTHAYRVHVALQQLLHRGEGASAVLLGQSLCLFRHHVVKTGDFTVGILMVLRGVADLGDLAAADNSYFHNNLHFPPDPVRQR